MKKFENIILASDIDGTFVWKSNETHPKNIEKIKYFNENGGHFLLSSGRNSHDIFVIIKQIREIVNTPCVLCNGCLLYDVQNDVIENPVYLNNEDLVKMIYDVDKNFPDVGFRASDKDGFLARQSDEYIKEELRTFGIYHIARFCDISAFKDRDIFKVMFCTKTKERCLELEEYVRARYSDKFALARSSDKMLEAMPLGISKAYQLNYLRKKMQKTNPDIQLWCIGDFDNDLDMLRSADVAACPENASDNVKDICSVHLCHCKDGAIADLIDLIEEKI